MKKKKNRFFVACFLFIVVCSSFVSAIASPLGEEGNSIYLGDKGNAQIDEEKKEENNEEEVTNKPEEENVEVGTEELEKPSEEKNEVPEQEKNGDTPEQDGKDEGLEQEEDKGEVVKPEENEEKNKEEQKAAVDDPQTITKDTFETVVGDYSLNTILNKYNVFSREDVVSGHIVGPVVGKKAYWTSKEHSEKQSIKIAEYSNGIPSFVGEVPRLKAGSNEAKFALNYGYEVPASAPPGTIINLKKPNLYINDTGNIVSIGGSQWDKVEKINDAEGEFNSPNNGGRSFTLQNDAFIDFEKAYAALQKESEAFLKSNSNIVVGESDYKIDQTGRLNLDVGKSYIIKDTTNLKEVNFIYPEGYDPIKKPYPKETIINIESKTLKEIILQGKKQNFLPEIYVNGKEFRGILEAETGKPALTPGHENGEIGSNNKVIWNMPNVETIGEEGRIVRNQRTDILGHIVAPKAEFWNYIIEEGVFRWIGGNMNGCAVVKSWHGGGMEIHYWPYNGEVKPPEEPRIALSVNAKKVFNKGSLVNPKFDFELKYDGEKLPEGILPENIPQTVHQKDDGSIEFLPITFTKEGVYNFSIKEVRGNDSDIIYDESEYKLKVTVFFDAGILKTKTEIVKFLNGAETVQDEIVFVNEKILKFTIEKKDKLTNELLQGAIFDLYEADENGKPKGEAIIKGIETDSTGKITVTNKVLEYNKLYVLVEKKAPDDYMLGENLVFYIKGEVGPYPEGEGIIVIENGGSVEVFNTKSDEVLPETGGMGTDKFLFTGLGLMLSALILFKIKLIKG